MKKQPPLIERPPLKLPIDVKDSFTDPRKALEQFQKMHRPKKPGKP